MFTYPSSLVPNSPNMYKCLRLAKDTSSPLNLKDIAIRCTEGEEEKIAFGGESNIYLARTAPASDADKVLVKVYDRGEIGDSDLSSSVVQSYVSDSLKAAEYFRRNPNPLGQNIEIHGKSYSVKHIVVPQGNSVLLENGIVCTVGQQFIPGKTLLKFLGEPSIDHEGSYDTAPLSNNEIEKLNEISLVLAGNFPADASKTAGFSGLNVKPKISSDMKTVNFYITDHCDTIFDDYYLSAMGFRSSLS